MNESGNFEKPNKIRIVENDHDFRERIHDTQNQFLMLRWDLNKNLPIEKLQENANRYTCLPFLEYIKTLNFELSPEILDNENYKKLISKHDELVTRVHNFKTIEELKQIIKEVDEFLVF